MEVILTLSILVAGINAEPNSGKYIIETVSGEDGMDYVDANRGNYHN